MSETAAGWLESKLGSCAFVSDYPLYGALLAGMEVAFNPNIPIMAVEAQDSAVRLHVNREYFEAHPAYFRGVLMHELHHVVLGHLDRIQSDRARPDLQRLAMEISANEYIAERLPDGAITWDRYTACGIAPGQSTAERHALLIAAARTDPSIGGGSDGTYLSDLIPGVVTSACRALVRSVMARAKHSRLGADLLIAGKSPGQILEQLAPGSSISGSRVDWQAVLRAEQPHARHRSLTLRRPNRRFPDKVGHVPGRGRVVSTAPLPDRVLVGIDTSGSMCGASLSCISREVGRIARLTRVC